MRLLRIAGAACAALSLAACATPEPMGPRPVPGPFPSQPPPPRPAPPPERTIPLTALPGWRNDDHLAAYEAFRQTCHVAKDAALARICREARATGPLGPEDARGFFEAHFRAERSPPAGVLTAYFAPMYEARRRPSEEFSAPLRPRPADLKIVDGGLFDPAQAGRPGAARDPGAGAPLEPYPDRAEIEATEAERVLAWMRPEELFFLQVQGSGVLTFEDGRRMKAVYAANNGRPFVGIANPMRDRGLLARDNTSGEAIRAWLASHRGPEADEIMRLNPRYVFFNLAPDDGKQAVGAANVPLPAGRAVAIDPLHHAYGQPLWIEGEAPLLAGAFPSYHRLVMALDTGGAIKGQVRADLYLGLGREAGVEAGRVRHTLHMYRLVPKDAS